MTARAVHWYEGMFLRPHQLQAAARYQAERQQFATRMDVHHYWGLRSADIDREALAAGRFVVRKLQARLLDGSLVSLPEDAALAPLELKPALEKNSPVTIYLGVPVMQLGRANVSESGTTADSGSVRFRVDTQELADENTGIDQQPVLVRRLNLQLLLSTQDRSGFELLPIARVERSPRAEAVPQLDGTYIPPVLACETWPVLRDDIVQAVYNRLGKKIDVLASQVVSRGIGLASTNEADALLINQLGRLNEAFAALFVLATTPGIHPLDGFMELGRIVGKLSIYGPTRRPPQLPRYDHDDLGGCFFILKRYIDDLLDTVVEPEYKERPFIGAGMRMQVTLEPSWLEAAWQMFIGVQSQIDSEELIRLLTRPGQLDMKVGSSDRVDNIFRLGQQGLSFAHTPRPPRSLPSMSGLIYFQVNRDAAQAEWLNVQRSLTLAVRLNESLIAGSIQGERTLNIKRAGGSAEIKFTLYVVPQQRGET